ncbi:MAG: nucleotide-binding universal stress UspA family protein [Gammaproteobacteria bacterium]|jgi:nucleotide-binding universal stress UspA family protein
MTIKDILVYLDNDKDCENRVEAAARLCKYYDAHIAGLYVTRTLNVHPYSYMPAGAFKTLKTHAEEKRAEAKKVFIDKTNAENIGGKFRDSQDHLLNTLCVQSRYADLLIIPRRYNGESDLNQEYLEADTIMGAACPILVLPEGQSALAYPPKKVMLAWDGSHECARALHLALPMLTKASELDVVSVSSNETEANDIALHLTRHGIDATVHLLEGSSFDAGSLLLKQAIALKSDLIVMGAFGHTRLREQILGGATKYILSHSPLPILFAH